MAYVRTQAQWVDGPGVTAVDAADLENYDQGLLATNDDLVILTWNGTTYQGKTGRAILLSDTSKVREFRGPVDPSTMSGVVMGNDDSWVPRP